MSTLHRSIFHHSTRHFTLNTCPKIPLINFNDKISNILPTIQESLTDTGFIYLENTPIKSHDIHKILNISRSFFTECSQDIKESINSYDTCFRGYYIYESGSINDKIECFSIGKELKNASILRESYYQKHCNNISDIWKNQISQSNKWPIQYKNMNEFRTILLKYYNLCCLTSINMLSLIAQSLNLKSNFFDKFHNLFDCTLEIKYYPPYVNVCNNDINMRLNEHADQTSITLLIQDIEDGLQVYNKYDKQWFNALCMDKHDMNKNDVLLCNTGDFMEMWTNNKYKSTLHRVISDKNNDNKNGRISIVFFCFPNHDAEIQTIESCVDFDQGQTVYKTICGDELPYMF